MLRQVDPKDGLEAWRVLYQDLNKKDQHQLDLEYQWLQTPVYRTSPKLQELTLIIAEWETKAQMRVSANSDYLIGSQQRKTIFMDLLPADARPICRSSKPNPPG